MGKFKLLLVALAASCGPLYAQDEPAVVTQALTKIVPKLAHALAEFGPGDLAVFDLDNTVFREAQTLGTDEWYTHVVGRLTARGLPKKQAMDNLEPVNRAIKTQSQMRLMEERLPALISDLQRKGVMVIGLTARHPNLAEATLLHLRQLGVNFTNLAVSGHQGFRWHEGTAYTDGGIKGTALKEILKHSSLKPQRIFAIDDRIHHLHSLAEAILELRVHGRLIHYLKAQEEPPFDPKIADLQFRVFRRLGRILSDAEAKVLMRRACEDYLGSANHTSNTRL